MKAKVGLESAKRFIFFANKQLGAEKPRAKIKVL
jgi:hypothetical protein